MANPFLADDQGAGPEFFLLLIGIALIGEGLDLHIPKGYIYFAMAFSVLVEMINLRIRKNPGPPTRLRRTYTPA